MHGFIQWEIQTSEKENDLLLFVNAITLFQTGRVINFQYQLIFVLINFKGILIKKAKILIVVWSCEWKIFVLFQTITIQRFMIYHINNKMRQYGNYHNNWLI